MVRQGPIPPRGRAFAYDNVAYEVAAMVVEHITGTIYADFAYAARQHKRVHLLRSVAEMEAFLKSVKSETQRS